MKDIASSCSMEDRLELERGVYNSWDSAVQWHSLSQQRPALEQGSLGRLEIRDGSNVFEVPLKFLKLVGSGNPVGLDGFLAICVRQVPGTHEETWLQTVLFPVSYLGLPWKYGVITFVPVTCRKVGWHTSSQI